MKTVLLLIDPQYDFCNPAGSLYVKGAEDDMRRVADMVKRYRFDSINCSLDSHPVNYHISFASFWENSDGSEVSPFTIISTAMVDSGAIRAKLVGMRSWARQYVHTLETNGKYPLCAWPDHCQIGSLGASMVPEIHDALKVWSESRKDNVRIIAKGSNPFTEHYSAIKADVSTLPFPDQSVQVDASLIDVFIKADNIVIAGEASSHCVANTVRDIAEGLGNDSYVKKFVFLTDGSSPVPGFEGFADTFITEMVTKGMQLATCKDF